MLLALRPELVAGARIPPRDAPSSAESDLYRWRSFAVRTETGVRGNPDAGTREQGERLIAAVAEALAGKLADPALWRVAFLPEAHKPIEQPL